MVALLEPFIDTIIICFFTGLVLLSSGAWNEKHDNMFQQADLYVLDGAYSEQNAADREAVATFILKKQDLPLFTGDLSVRDGKIESGSVTIIHARSFAEAVIVKESDKPFNGQLAVDKGRVIYGKSLLHSAPLSSEAFKKGFFGDWGKYVIPLSLLLFAFTTAVAWSYYGDRAVTFLWGNKYVKYYHIIYVIAFFIASFTDTTIIWTFSGIAIAMMAIPNLIGILFLHKEIKSLVAAYWAKIKLLEGK